MESLSSGEGNRIQTKIPTQYHDFIAGAVGGSLSVVMSHPIDTIKTRLQITNKYRGILDCFAKMRQTEGLRSFYKGMSFPFISVAAANFLAFGAYGNMLRYLDPNPDHADLVNVIIAGAASGTAICLLSPVELVKIRSQMVTDGKRGPVSVIRELYQNGGFGKNGLFRGFTAQLARDPIGYSMYFAPYTIILRQLDEIGGYGNSPISFIFAGAFAGAFTWAATNPIDVVKTQYQNNLTHPNPIFTLKYLYKTEGFSFLTRGIVSNSLRGIPQSGFLFLGYELTMGLLKS